VWAEMNFMFMHIFVEDSRKTVSFLLYKERKTPRVTGAFFMVSSAESYQPGFA
jgi:hypothetical protein